MWASAAHYKEIPPGASEPMVWDRCNYSDNIRESALPAVLSPRLPACEAWAGVCSYLVLSFTSSPCLFVCTHLFTLIFSSVYSFLSFLTSFLLLHELIHIFLLSCKNTCSYIQPYLVLFVKQNLFHWDGNQMKGNHAVTLQLLIVPPTPPSLLTVSPKQDRCSVCMLPAFPTSIFLPGIPDYCSICLIVVSECLLFVQCGVLEVSASIQNVPV